MAWQRGLAASEAFMKTEVDENAFKYDECRTGVRGSQDRRQGRYQEVFGIAGFCAGRQGDRGIRDFGKLDSQRQRIPGRDKPGDGEQHSDQQLENRDVRELR